MKILVAFLFAMFFSLSVSAEIDVIQMVPSYGSTCSGKFTVRANGTAGPFTVTIYRQIGAGDFSLLTDEQIVNDVSSSTMFAELCNGTYLVRVAPTRFPSCITFLEAVLEDPKRLEVEPYDKAGVLGLEVSPNPTRGKVTILTANEPATGALPDHGDWKITVTDANGLPLQELKQTGVAKRSQQSFPLDLGKYPRGVYFIRVVAPGGAAESRRVVLQ